MGSSSLVYDFDESVISSRESLDKLAAFFPEDVMVGTLRTKLSLDDVVQQLTMDKDGSADTWKSDLAIAKARTEKIMKTAVETENPVHLNKFLSDSGEGSDLQVIQQARAVQGRLRDLASFMRLVQNSIQIRQEPESRPSEKFQTTLDKISTMATVLGNGVQAVFAVRSQLAPVELFNVFLAKLGQSTVEEVAEADARQEAIKRLLETKGAGTELASNRDLLNLLLSAQVQGTSSVEAEKIRRQYVDLVDKLLGGVDSLRTELKQAYNTFGFSTLKAQKMIKDLKEAGMIDADNKWNPDKINDTPTGVEKPGSVIRKDPETPIDLSKPITEYNFEQDILKEDDRSVIAVRSDISTEVGEPAGENLSRLNKDAEAALKILKFFHGTNDQPGIFKKLLVQRGALAQSTANIEKAVNKRYDDMARDIKKTVTEMLSYESDTGAEITRPIMKKTVVEFLTDAEVVVKVGDNYEWLKSGGGYRTAADGSIFEQKPFSQTFMEDVTVSEILGRNPEVIKQAIKAISDAYWISVETQEAIARVMRDKVSTMRNSVFKLYNNYIVNKGLAVTSKMAIGDIKSRQARLQKADMFPTTWQGKGVNNKAGTEQKILKRFKGTLEEYSVDTIFEEIDAKETLAKSIPVENLLHGLVVETVEPTMTSFGEMFDRLNDANIEIFKLLQLQIGSSGINKVLTAYGGVKDLVDENSESVKEALTRPTERSPTPLSNTSKIMDSAFIKEENTMDLHENIKLKDMVSEIQTIYSAVQSDAVSALEVLKVCVTDGAIVVKFPKIVKEEMGEEGVSAVERVLTVKEIYRRIVQAFIVAVNAGDNKYVAVRYANPDPGEDGHIEGFDAGDIPELDPKNIDHKNGFLSVFAKVFKNDERILGVIRGSATLDPYSPKDVREIKGVENFIKEAVTRLSKERYIAIEKMSDLFDAEKSCLEAAKKSKKDLDTALKSKEEADKETKDLKKKLEEATEKLSRGEKEYTILRGGFQDSMRVVASAHVFSSDRMKLAGVSDLGTLLGNTLARKFGTWEEAGGKKKTHELEQALSGFNSKTLNPFFVRVDERYGEIMISINKDVSEAANKIIMALKEFKGTRIQAARFKISKTFNVAAAIESLRKVEEVIADEARAVEDQKRKLKSDIETLNREKETLKQTKASKETTISQLNATIKEMEKMIRNLESQVKTAQKVAETAAAVKASQLQVQIQQQKTQIASLKAELDAVRAEKTKVDETMKEIEFEADELVEAEEKISQLEHELADKFNKVAVPLNNILLYIVEQFEARIPKGSGVKKAQIKPLQFKSEYDVDVFIQNLEPFSRDIVPELKRFVRLLDAEITSRDATIGKQNETIAIQSGEIETLNNRVSPTEFVNIANAFNMVLGASKQAVSVVITSKIKQIPADASTIPGKWIKSMVSQADQAQIELISLERNFRDKTAAIQASHKESLARINAEREQLEGELNASKNQMARLTTQITENNRTIGALREKIASLEKQVDSAQEAQMDAIASKTAELKKEIKILHANNAQLSKSLTNEQTTSSKLSGQIGILKTEINNLESDLSLSREANKAVSLDFATAVQEAEKLRNQLRAITESAAGPVVSREISALQVAISNKDAEIESLKENLLNAAAGGTNVFPYVKTILEVLWELPTEDFDVYPSDLINAKKAEAETARAEGRNGDVKTILETIEHMKNANDLRTTNKSINRLTKDGGEQHDNYIKFMTHVLARATEMDKNTKIKVESLVANGYPPDLGEKLKSKTAKGIDVFNDQFEGVLAGVLALSSSVAPIINQISRTEDKCKILEKQLDALMGPREGRKKRKIILSEIEPSGFSITGIGPDVETFQLTREIEDSDSTVSISDKLVLSVEEDQQREATAEEDIDNGWSLWL